MTSESDQRCQESHPLVCAASGDRDRESSPVMQRRSLALRSFAASTSGEGSCYNSEKNDSKAGNCSGIQWQRCAGEGMAWQPGAESEGKDIDDADILLPISSY